MLLALDPKIFRAIFVSHADKVEKFPQRMDVMAQLNGKGVIVSSGPLWEQQRKLVHQGLSPSALDRYMQSIAGVIREWRQQTRGDFYVKRQMAALTLQMKSFLLFGHGPGNREGEVLDAIKEVSRAFTREFGQIWRRPDWWPSKNVRKKRNAIRIIEGFGDHHLLKLAANKGEGSILSPMIRALDPKIASTKKQIRDEVITLLTAGQDTTWAVLSWCCLELAKDKTLRETLFQEVAQDSVADKSATQVIVEAWPKLTSFVYECLRMYPPAIALFIRRAKESFQVENYLIERALASLVEVALPKLVQPLSREATLDFAIWPAENFQPHFGNAASHS